MSTDDPTTDMPAILRPDEHEVGAADEPYCWMPGSEDRECNGSCVAFEERSLDDDRMDTCKALNALRSIAMSLGVQAKVARGTEAKAEVAARKAQIEKIPEPPEVTS